MKKETLDESIPQVRIDKVVDNPNGSCDITFTATDAFIDVCKKELGKKRVSKKDIGDFLVKLLEDMAKHNKLVKQKKKRKQS